jgi:uncharacterized coiled-coil protein SlyX
MLLSIPILRAQVVPTISTPPNGGQTSGDYWSRAGNTSIGNNIFGTMWNSPIYTVTGNTFTSGNNYRSKLNGILGQSTQYPINGFGFGNTVNDVNTTGYMLLGNNVGSFYQNMGAFSLLHLNGQDNTGIGQVQEFGYRPWMKTGITFTGNSDLSYMGMRQVGTGTDVTETTISWADNAGGNSGPDELTFRYTQGTFGDGANNLSTDFTNASDLDGRHIARFTGEGLMGLGNTFGINTTGTPASLYSRPQSLLHMSYQFKQGAAYALNGFQQITYRRADGETSDMIGQGELATDGLRLGIDNTVYNFGTAPFLNSYLRWQEASSFIIQTEDGGPPNIEQNERMRFTSIGALVANQGANYGGLTAPSNVSRVAISHNGLIPVTKPLSLLHLGYQTFGGGSDGWRDWMDIGIYTSNGTDQVFLGLKPENGSGTLGDRQDAVLNWGDNMTGAGSPDNFRMIFTSAPGGTAPATGANGLEGLRMTPTTATGIYTGIGGDPTSNTYVGGNSNPTATLEVNSWGQTTIAGGSSGLRFTNLNTTSPTVANPGKGVLAVNASGDVIYVDALTSPGGNGGFGAACFDDTNGKLLFDTKVDLNNHNLYFVNNDLPGQNHIGIGYNCSQPLPAKLSVWQSHPSSVNQSTIALSAVNADVSQTTTVSQHTGITGQSIGAHTASGYTLNTGGEFYAANARENYGVFASVLAGSQPQSFNTAGVFRASGGEAAMGVRAVGGAASNNNYGMMINGFGGTNAYGIIAEGSGASNMNYAGYFNGVVEATGYITTPSDQQFKTNVTNLEGSLEKLSSLRPVSYHMDQASYPQFNFDSGLQFGFIAQELDTVFPNLVHQSMFPTRYDSIGNVTHPAVSYKSVNYTAMIPVNTQAIIELNKKVESKDSVITVLITENTEQQSTIDAQQKKMDELNERLSKLESCLSGILPELCKMSRDAVKSTTPEDREEVRKNLTVLLSSRSTIILDQNVPNPFAEQTVINFSIPETVKKAQLHFYDGTGRLMHVVEIAERGLGSLTVFGSDLSSGIYTYTLVADGLVVSSMRMVKE